MSTCWYCNKPIFGTGLKCKECKYKCHRECEDKVTPSCGLPPEFLDEFKRKLPIEGGFPSPNSARAINTKNIIISFTKPRKRSHNQPSINIPPFPVRAFGCFFFKLVTGLIVIVLQPPDSSSNTSSCNSSTPSSPAVQQTHTPHSNVKAQFHFPG